MSGLTPQEEKAAIAFQRRVEEVANDQDKKLEAEKKLSRAAHKIQIWIKSERSIHKPLVFSLSVWSSGKRLHGGGDESLFFCMRHPGAPKPKAPPGTIASLTAKTKATENGCGAVIPQDASAGGKAVCPNCGALWNTEHISDSIMYKLDVGKAAATIADWWHKLEGDADIYVKYRDQDIRVQMQAQQMGIKKARQLKGLTIYRRASIVRDTLAGSTVEARFKALLLA